MPSETPVRPAPGLPCDSGARAPQESACDLSQASPARGAPKAVVLRRCGVGDEVERCGFGDGDGHEVPGRGASAPAGYGEVHQPLVLGPAGEPVGFLGFASGLGRDHDLHAAAQLAGVFLGRDPVLQGGEPLEAFLDDGFGQLVRQVRSGGARAAWSTGT